MSIVKADEPVSIRVVQRQGVAQPVRPFRRRLCPLGLEFEPVALFEVMDATIKRQQEFESVFVGNGSLA